MSCDEEHIKQTFGEQTVCSAKNNNHYQQKTLYIPSNDIFILITLTDHDLYTLFCRQNIFVPGRDVTVNYS